jgi:hypothetical protein
MIFDLGHPNIRVSMPALIKDLVKVFEVKGMASSPTTLDAFEEDMDSPPLDLKRQAAYHTAVNTVLYPATHGRWDLLFAFSVLSKQVNNPTEQSWGRLQRLLKYLNATPDKALELRADELEVHYATDTAHIVHPRTGKGHLGVAISLGQHAPAIYAMSTSMKQVTRSTAETEMVGFTEQLPIALWLARLLKHMGLIEDSKVYGWQDNQAAITLIKTGRPCSSRTRHIDVRAFWAKEFLESDELAMNYQPGKDLSVDGLSKPKIGLARQEDMDNLMGTPN